ncbi:MAG: NAD(P)H-dependent glycerol-3-phosphate dehydrogenase [Candidatus Omnitrophota bacterium]
MKEKVSILGAGGWGTTLAVVLAQKKDLDVTLWSPFKDHVDEIKRDRQNKIFLPGVDIPPSLSVTADLPAALVVPVLIVAIPVEYLRQTLQKIKRVHVSVKGKIFVSVIKGIEIKNLVRPSQILAGELGISLKQIAVLSGPTIAKEVASGIPSVATVASHVTAYAARIQKLFSGTTLRVYTHNDVVGIETAGALKNIIAIACGISDGLGFGTNTKSALICRGLKEMIRFASAFKIKPPAFLGISGIGDLCTTCFSSASRNRSLGEAIGRGAALAEVLGSMKTVAEGVGTTKAVYRLSKKYSIDMPITREIYAVLYNKKTPQKAVKDLMARPLKAE